MERVRIIPPSAILAPYVKHYWLLATDLNGHSQRVVASGGIELLFHRGCPMKRNGQLIPTASLSRQSLSVTDLTPTGEVDMIAVVFHPFGAKAFFDVPLYELSQLMVSADELGCDSLKELEQQIRTTADDIACIGLIESFLLGRLHPFKEYNYPRLVAAVGAINRGSCSTSDLAQTVCLSKKQFHRIFREHVGATPNEFIRIVRFQKALYTLQHRPTLSFTALAYECGYYDQAHMTHEFKLFSGYTPSQYVAIYTPYSDYFST